jgi:hypothetical protein
MNGTGMPVTIDPRNPHQTSGDARYLATAGVYQRFEKRMASIEASQMAIVDEIIVKDRTSACRREHQ